MRHAAGVALTTSACFLAVVAIMLNSGALFYMSTAIIATIMASRLQAWLSVRGLHFDRYAPETARVGDLVTVDITVWSERRIRRPLVSVLDSLPSKMLYTDRTPSLPIAPAFDIPIRSQYSFRPRRRGRFRWSALTVVGTDALGLVSQLKTYDGPAVELLVVPNPLALDYDIPPAPAYGISESESGQGRGAGIEPRGIRDYVSGDSLRFVHWRSSARAGKLLVKEFATGTHASMAFVFQRTQGTDVGIRAETTLEQMCANAAYMTEKLLRMGAEISFPTLGFAMSTHNYQDHQQEVLATLATVEADSLDSVSQELEVARKNMPAGGLVYVFVGIADEGLAAEIRRCLASAIQVVVMAYDAAEFVAPKDQDAIETAASVSYLDSLRNVGARVVFVPKAESVQ